MASIQTDAAAPPDYEGALQVAYESFLRPGDTAIDVGAHVGRHTLPIARRVLPGGQVIAFEPLPFCRTMLEDTLAFELGGARERVRVLPFALGERAASTEFVVAQDAPEYSGLQERVYDVPTRLERIPVEVRTLDELTADLDRLRYLKIDAEGGEYHILAGARALLRRLRPITTVEFGVNSCAKYGVTPQDLSRLLRELEYRCFDIRGRDVSDEAVFAASATRQEVWDYLAIPSEQLEVFHQSIRPALERSFMRPALPEQWKDACHSRLELVDPPGRIVVPQGGRGRVMVCVTNAGGIPWDRWQAEAGAAVVRLGIQWHQPSAPPWQWLAEARAELPLPMAPGSNAVLVVPLRPAAGDKPLPRGDYEVWFAPLIEGVAWFTDQGDAPLKLPVTVE